MEEDVTVTGEDPRLHLVPPASERGGPLRSGADVGVTGMIFLVSAIPLVSALAGVGRWDPASLGLGTLGVLLAGRELAAGLLAARRTRRHP
jgi:hypothetical protein